MVWKEWMPQPKLPNAGILINSRHDPISVMPDPIQPCARAVTGLGSKKSRLKRCPPKRQTFSIT
jgi:hypothetical protein